jgi:WD40 repeat protein
MQADEGMPPPDEINCGEQVFDISFHPSMDLLAVAMINGQVDLYKYSRSPGSVPSTRMMSCQNHTSSCRGVKFDPSGQGMYTISSDRSIVALNGEGVVVSRREAAHDDSINKLIVMQENTFATGDDAGVVKLWLVQQAGLLISNVISCYVMLCHETLCRIL